MDNEIKIQVLKYAKDILTNRGWCQGWFAKDIDGMGCDETDDKAVCFCSIGAISRAIMELKQLWKFKLGHTCIDIDTVTVCDYLSGFIPTAVPDIVFFNDIYCITKEEVLTLFDKAIANGQCTETTDPIRPKSN